MGCCNDTATALASAKADPSQHVNYVKGMVLGVDDFTLEFAYLAGHDQWLARDAIGYGTLSGLRVHAEVDAKEGLRLHVGAGSALVPSGRLVCVPSDQCAALNKWLAKKENARIVRRLLGPESPPVSPPLDPADGTTGEITLALTLCYDSCTTQPVPIPGEPCRSADELMEDSRVADDYRLELREHPPEQVEEDALRDFVRWLHTSVQLGDASPASPADEPDWIEALREAARPWLDAAAASPPQSPPPSYATLGDYLSDVSPPVLAVPRDQFPELLRVAFRFWVTELCPLWMTYRCGQKVGADAECVLLACVTVNVTWEVGSPTGAWQVAGSPPEITIDESARPFVGHLRLLQEWALAGREADPSAPTDDAAFLLAQSHTGLPQAQSLGALSTGLLKNTVVVGKGTLSAAVAGTDYVAPGAVMPVSDGGTGTGSAPGNGQLLIGNAGGYAVAGLTGTPDEIAVTPGPGSITLSTPQALATTSSPTFAGLTTSTLQATASATVGGLTSTLPAKLAGLTTTAAVHMAVNKAANGMTLDETHHVLLCRVAAVNLPPAQVHTGGRVYVLKNAGVNAVTVAAASGETIDGNANIELRMWQAATLVSDGNGHWYVLARG